MIQKLTLTNLTKSKNIISKRTSTIIAKQNKTLKKSTPQQDLPSEYYNHFMVANLQYQKHLIEKISNFSSCNFPFIFLVCLYKGEFLNTLRGWKNNIPSFHINSELHHEFNEWTSP